MQNKQAERDAKTQPSKNNELTTDSNKSYPSGGAGLFDDNSSNLSKSSYHSGGGK